MNYKCNFLLFFTLSSSIFLLSFQASEKQSIPLSIESASNSDNGYKDSLYNVLPLLLNNFNKLYINRELDAALAAAYRLNFILDTLNAIDSLHQDDLLGSYIWIGSIYKMKGEFDSASKVIKSAINKFDIQSPDNTHLGILYSNLANIYNDMGEYSSSLEYNLKALKLTPDTSCNYYFILNSLANIYEVLGNNIQADSIYTQSLANVKGIYGNSSIQAALLYLNKAKIRYVITKDPRISIKYLDSASQILKLTKDSLTESHVILYSHYGFCHQQLKNYDSALYYYFYIESAIVKIYGQEHFKLSTLYRNLSNVFRETSQPKLALDYIGKAIEIDKLNFGEEHYNMAYNYNNLASLFYDMQDNKKSKEYYTKSYNILLKLFGVDHPSTKEVLNNLKGL